MEARISTPIPATTLAALARHLAGEVVMWTALAALASLVAKLVIL